MGMFKSPATRRLSSLCLDLVLSLEHVVNLCEVVCTLWNRIHTTFGSVVLLEVSLLS